MRLQDIYYVSIIIQIFLSTSAESKEALENGTVIHSNALPSNRGRIMGGEAIQINEAPWQVSIYFAHNRMHFCGGSLIGAQFVLTAAHCFPKGMRADEIEVMFGASRRPTDTDWKYHSVKVSAIIIHPDYVDHFGGYDIAVLLLAQMVKLNGHQTRIIQMADKQAPNTTLCKVSGFGFIDGNGARTNVLRAADVRILDQNQCIEKWGGYSPAVYKDLIICTHPNDKSHRGGDTCKGDSGGPLTCLHDGKYFIQGLTSFGPPNSCLDGAYTNMVPLKGWVMNVMKEIKRKFNIGRKQMMQQQINQLPNNQRPISTYQNGQWSGNPLLNNRPWNNPQQNYRSPNNAVSSNPSQNILQQNHRLPNNPRPMNTQHNIQRPSTPNNRPWNNPQQNNQSPNYAVLNNPSQNIPHQNNRLPYIPNQNMPLQNSQWHNKPPLTNSQHNIMQPNVQIQHNSFLGNQRRSSQ